MKNKVAEQVFLKGNKKDGKHYWLTPNEVKAVVTEITGILFESFFDPCPYPRPEGFDGLEVEWGKWTYVNPPFGVLEKLVLNKKGKLVKKKIGLTAWARKCVFESKLGKLVVLIVPIHGWVVEAMIAAGANVYHFKNVKWLATEDGKPGKGSGSTAMFIFDGRKNG
jgi:hypothetical protein